MPRIILPLPKWDNSTSKSKLVSCLPNSCTGEMFPVSTLHSLYGQPILHLDAILGILNLPVISGIFFNTFFFLRIDRAEIWANIFLKHWNHQCWQKSWIPSMVLLEQSWFFKKRGSLTYLSRSGSSWALYSQLTYHVKFAFLGAKSCLELWRTTG